MHFSQVVESSRVFKPWRVSAAAIGVCVGAAALGASYAAASSPTSRACPSASLVNAALGHKGKAPVATKTAYSKTCTYSGGSIIPTTITFQVDTSSTFAAGEKAAAAALPNSVVKLSGLGQAAWATKTGGSLYVFDAGTTIKILSLLTATSKLEALARKLL